MIRLNRWLSKAGICGMLFSQYANALDNTKRGLKPASVKLPVFFLERMMQEQVSEQLANWQGPGTSVLITTQQCRPVFEMLQPEQEPLRLALVRKEGETTFKGSIKQSFDIGLPCGSNVQFELNLDVEWIPSEKRVEVLVFGLDQNENRSGAADWVFQLSEENPMSIDLVIPRRSFQSGVLDDAAPGETHGACSGFRVSNFEPSIDSNEKSQ